MKLSKGRIKCPAALAKIFGKAKGWHDARKEKTNERIQDEPYWWRARLDRWFKVRFHGYVKLRTLTYDEDTQEYTLTQELIRRKDAPRSSVHCTGEPDYRADDQVHIRYAYHDNGFGALNAELYMECNKISDALAHKWNMSGSTDWIKLGVIVICVIFVAFYVAEMYL